MRCVSLGTNSVPSGSRCARSPARSCGFRCAVIFAFMGELAPPNRSLRSDKGTRRRAAAGDARAPSEQSRPLKPATAVATSASDRCDVAAEEASRARPCAARTFRRRRPYLQRDRKHLDAVAGGHREDQVVATRHGRPRARAGDKGRRKLSRSPGPDGVSTSILGAYHRLVGREPVEIDRELVGAGDRDQLEGVGGRLRARRNAARRRRRRRLVIMAFMGGPIWRAAQEHRQDHRKRGGEIGKA